MVTVPHDHTLLFHERLYHFQDASYSTFQSYKHTLTQVFSNTVNQLATQPLRNTNIHSQPHTLPSQSPPQTHTASQSHSQSHSLPVTYSITAKQSSRHKGNHTANHTCPSHLHTQPPRHPSPTLLATEPNNLASGSLHRSVASD